MDGRRTNFLEWLSLVVAVGWLFGGTGGRGDFLPQTKGCSNGAKIMRDDDWMHDELDSIVHCALRVTRMNVTDCDKP